MSIFDIFNGTPPVLRRRGQGEYLHFVLILAHAPHGAGNRHVRGTVSCQDRRKDESLSTLLARLDLAIARAHTDIFTDEINHANAKRP